LLENNIMASFKISVAAVVGFCLIGSFDAVGASRPDALKASFTGILMDGPLAGQVAIGGAIPSNQTRHIKTRYGIVVCIGGNTQVDLEKNRPASGTRSRSCQWQ
jgi:hypothetical protein